VISDLHAAIHALSLSQKKVVADGKWAMNVFCMADMYAKRNVDGKAEILHSMKT